jgi:hypothetical protein
MRSHLPRVYVSATTVFAKAFIATVPALHVLAADVIGTGIVH